MTREEVTAIEARNAGVHYLASQDACLLAREWRVMLDNLTATQKRCTELLEENRDLRAPQERLESCGACGAKRP